MPTAVEQYQTLTGLWPKWRTIAQSTGDTDRDRAEAAINRLYHFYDYPTPTFQWCDVPRRIPGTDHPVMLTFRNTLVYASWHTLKHPEWLATQVGYDRRMHEFRMVANKRLVLAASIMAGGGRRRSPYWMTATGASNVISQFDVDALAIHELAATIGNADKSVQTLADIVRDIAESCFAALLFNGVATVIDKPSRVSLNDALQLSAMQAPAIAWETPKPKASPLTRQDNGRFIAREPVEDHTLYAVNGEFLGRNTEPTLSDYILHASPRQRTLTIEYFGWDHFFDVLRKKYRSLISKLNEDKYGKVYRLVFRNQIFHVVRVIDASPEPDGSYARHVIPIDHQCRPLPDPRQPYSRHGSPQLMTGLNAVASTFGMTGEAYEAMLGNES